MVPKTDAFVIVLVSVVTVFTDAFDIKGDTDEVIIDFKNAKVFDHSGIEAVNMLTEKYKNAGKILHLRHLSMECYQLIKNADEIVEVNIIEDPKHRVADDSLA